MEAENDALVQVSAAEWLVLECLWREGPLYMADLVEQLRERTSWSRTTVLTLASRLEQKGYIGTERSQRAYLYVPVVSRKLAVKERVDNFVRESFGGDYYALAKVLAESGELDEDDLKKLRDRSRKQPKKSAGKKSKKKA